MICQAFAPRRDPQGRNRPDWSSMWHHERAKPYAGFSGSRLLAAYDPYGLGSSVLIETRGAC